MGRYDFDGKIGILIGSELKYFDYKAGTDPFRGGLPSDILREDFICIEGKGYNKNYIVSIEQVGNHE